MTAEIGIEAYDIKSLCKAFNVSRSFAYAEMDAGHLKYVKVGRRRLIPRPYALEWLHSRGETPKPADASTSSIV